MIFEELDIGVVDFVVGFVVFLDADIQRVLVDDLDVGHVLVYYVLVDLPCFLAEVEEVLIIAVAEVLHLATVEEELPDGREAFESVLVHVELLEVGEVELAVGAGADAVVVEVEVLETGQEEQVEP